MNPAAVGGALRVLATALVLLTAGCMRLPPKAPQPVLRAEAPVAADLGAGTVPADGRMSGWPDSDWWRAYQDPTLTALIEKALSASPSLAAAQARFGAAQAEVRTAAAAAGLQVTASGDVSRQRLSDNGFIPPRFLGFHWYDQSDLGLSFSYAFDWWGRQRALLNAALDSAQAAEADRAAARLLLTASIAETYFGWQTDQARLALAQQRQQNVEQQTQLAQMRLAADIARIDELQQTQMLQSVAQQQLGELDSSAHLRLVALAALLACRPEQLPSLSAQPLPEAPLQLPPNVSLDLIARRPDIEASRWRVEAASRGVAAARAGFLPNVSLSALLGVSSISLGKLLEAGSAVPQIGAAIHLPIFDAGALRGQYEGSQAQLQSAIAAYDDTVVSAARDVGTQALTLLDLQTRARHQREQLDVLQQMRSTVQSRADAGITDARASLSATAQWIDSQDALLQLNGAALTSDVELIRALGGGYQRTEQQSAPSGSPNHE